MEALFNTMPQVGKVEWIGVRPKKKMDLQAVKKVEIDTEAGLSGDHYAGRSKKRQVTLIQKEHLDTVASILQIEQADPMLTRRNIVVSGINLLALKDQQFRIGTALLETTGLCHPCSRMEENFGPGGYNAMRGHGGITAKVIESGIVALGDAIQLELSVKVEK